MTVRRHAPMLAAVLPLLAIVGCAGLGAGMKPTITEEQAIERVDRYIELAMREIGGGRLEVNGRRVMACTKPDDGGPQGRVVAYANYYIRDFPIERYAAAFQSIRDYWKRANFRVLDDATDSAGRFLWGENRDDGFGMTLEESVDGTGLSLIVSSPCVWPNGTPEPTE